MSTEKKTQEEFADEEFADEEWTEEQFAAYVDYFMTAEKSPQVEMVVGASGRFGYDPTNPIAVNGPQGQIDYLTCLECRCHHRFLFHRCGSMDPGPDGHIIDRFELVCTRQTCHIKLYMDMYHVAPTTLVPEGLGITKPRGKGVLSRVVGLLRSLVIRTI